MKKVTNLVLGLCALALLYLCYSSIMEPINFNNEKEMREAAVKERLIQIRDAEEQYRLQKGEFCDSFPELIAFIKDGKVPFINKVGELTDEQMDKGLTEAKAASIVNSGNAAAIAANGLQNFRRAVKEAIRRGYQEILMVGMLGGRLDHTLANIQTLVYAVQHGESAQIIDKGCRITVIKDNQSVTIPYERGFHFSVFCHSDKAQGVSIRHAKYELEDADITNGFPIGVSNAFLPGEDAQVSIQKGILVIVANQGE